MVSGNLPTDFQIEWAGLIPHFKVFNNISGWLSVTRNVKFDYDLEEHPLQIKTNSAVGSEDVVALYLYTAGGAYISNIRLVFYTTPHYRIYRCTDYTTFPVDVPAEQDKIWTITKTATAIKIECNEVEVVNLYSDSSDDECAEIYSEDVERIKFANSDTASDEYRQKPAGV